MFSDSFVSNFTAMLYFQTENVSFIYLLPAFLGDELTLCLEGIKFAFKVSDSDSNDI